jgi:hypothetical protein
MNATGKWAIASGAALVFAGVIDAAQLPAQEATAIAVGAKTAESSADTLLPRWSISVGTDLTNFSVGRGSGVRGDFFGSVSREWQSSVSRLAFRTELMLGATRTPGASVTRQFGSISELAKYSFGRGSFRPYLIGGPGLYFERMNYSVPCFDLGVCTPSQIPLGYNPNARWSLGLGAGVGADMKIGRSRLFVEQRLNMPDVLSDTENMNYRRPFSFGIRF